MADEESGGQPPTNSPETNQQQNTPNDEQDLTYISDESGFLRPSEPDGQFNQLTSYSFTVAPVDLLTASGIAQLHELDPSLAKSLVNEVVESGKHARELEKTQVNGQEMRRSIGLCSAIAFISVALGFGIHFFEVGNKFGGTACFGVLASSILITLITGQVLKKEKSEASNDQTEVAP